MIKGFWEFIQLIFYKKKLIASMAKREIRQKYIGSIFGLLWAFIHPIIMVIIFWLIFSVGFRVQPVDDVPFVVWLMAGMSVWYLFSDIVSGSTTVILENKQLIKKTLFPVSILPLVKVCSGVITHTIFLSILFILIVSQQLTFSWYNLQVLYYLFCTLVLALGMSWLVSALNVFIKDTSQVVGVMLQVGFWGTPIFWDINIMPEKWQHLFKFNPMYYIVKGYRDSFIYFDPFWHYPTETAYFWITTIIIFLIGVFVFKKLRPQFADVL